MFVVENIFEWHVLIAQSVKGWIKTFKPEHKSFDHKCIRCIDIEAQVMALQIHKNLANKNIFHLKCVRYPWLDYKIQFTNNSDHEPWQKKLQQKRFHDLD